MFPLQIHIPFVAITYFTLFFSIQAIQGFNTLKLTWASLVGFLTLFGVTLLMRILDEFKDVETDRRLFPHRPLLRGAVKYSDIRILGILVFSMLIFSNLWIGGWVLVFFLIMIFYEWLTYKWFFNEKKMRDNLMLALVSHQPLVFFTNIYVIITAMESLEINAPVYQYLLVILAFFLPIFSWETCRKIRAVGKETEYVTYSKLFGPRKASLLPLVGMILFLLAIGYIASILQFHFFFYLLLCLVAISLIIAFVRFINKPIPSRMIIKPITELSTSITLIITLCWLIAKYGIS
jgi:4-hydroxybenzoate polyprenyltransferase